MNASQFNTNISVPQLHEASKLKSPREKDSIYHVWKYINQTVEAANKHSRDIAQLNRELKRIGDRRKLGFDLFPFKIYILPDIFRSSNIDPAINWRTVRVRGGYVLTDAVSTSSYVHGTDGLQEYAYGNSYNLTTGSADITLSDNSFYWFWVEENNSAYTLRYDTNPNSTGSIGNPNGWTSFPTADTSHIPIGYVDTESSSSSRQALIRNLIDSDIVTKGGGVTYAIFDENAGYSTDTIIWVDPSKHYSIPFTSTSGSTPPLSLGSFWVVKSVPPSGSGRNSGNCYYPVYPHWPSGSTVTISGSTYNSIFFEPIAPRMPTTVCINGKYVDAYGAIELSGSGYQYKTPYP